MLKKLFPKLAIASALAISLSACTGADGIDGADGKDGKDAAEVNVDSLANVLRKEITGTLWDSLYAEPYVDTVYNILFDNAFATAWMDSVRDALLDSLKLADYDSLYEKLYDSVYADICSRTVTRTLDAWVHFAKEDIYGAYANLYPIMYADYKNSNGDPLPVPVSVKVRHTCDRSTSQSCRWKKIMLKSWVEGFTDTAVVTGNVNPDDQLSLAPKYTFDNDALIALKAPKATQIQLRAYALENDHEILFFSASEPTTVHPMQVNGAELVNVKNRRWFEAVWITPGMDSIATILDEIASLLPNKTLKVYQRYSEDESIAESSMRVMDAVFKVLQKKGIKYIENDGIGSIGQKINYPVEVLRSKQAVCNEFSFLVASVLEAIGFDVYIVNIPSHMFVGWSIEEGSADIGFIETTMLAHDNATFANAFTSAVTEFAEQQEAGNFENGKSSIFSLADARVLGITPNDIP